MVSALAQMDEARGVRLNPNFERSSTLNDIDEGYMLYNPIDRRTGKVNLQEQARIASTYFPHDLGSPRAYMQKTSAALKILEEAMYGGRVGRARFLEAISYDDFNYIMQDTIYRRMMEKWQVPDSPFEDLCREIKVPTMQRPGKLFTLDGLETPIPLVLPGEQPTLRSPYDSGIAIRPYKYMTDVELLWETMVEDDLNALGDIPNRLDNAIKASRGRIYTLLYAKQTGFRNGASEPFSQVQNDKILNPTLDPARDDVNPIRNLLQANQSNHSTPINAPLSLPAIQAARSQMSKFLSPDGNPIDVKVVHLVVGVGQRELANNVLGAQQYTMERSGGIPATNNAGFVRMQVGSEATSGIRLHVDPYLHVVADAGNIADTMWMLVAEKDIARPLFFKCSLAGYEAPIIQRRVPMYRGVGQNQGSSVDWISTGFRCGFILGTQWGDARGAIASFGTGGNSPA